MLLKTCGEVDPVWEDMRKNVEAAECGMCATLQNLVGQAQVGVEAIETLVDCIRGKGQLAKIIGDEKSA